MKRYRSLFYATAFIALAIISCKSHGDKDVNEPNPVAAFDVAAEIPKDSVRTLTNNSTNADSYAWSVTPSTGVVITDPAAKNVVLKFTAEGDYTITLQAKKAGKPTSMLEKTVKVTADPIADFTYKFADINVAPVKVKLDGSTSANATTYQWAMVNGGPNIINPTASAPDSVNFQNAGTYTVRLTVTKGAKQSVKEQTITILPGPDFTYTKNAATPVTVTYTNTTPVGNFDSFQWSFEASTTPFQSPTTKTYKSPGTVDITLIAKKNGFTRTKTYSVNVTDPSLKGFFPLEGTGAQIITDRIGNMGGQTNIPDGSVGTLFNLALTADRANTPNTAVFFDGQDDKFTMNALQNVFGSAGGNISISLWVRFSTGLDHSRIMLFCHNTAGNQYTPILYFSAVDSTIYGAFPTGAVTQAKATGVKITSTTAWYNIVLTGNNAGNNTHLNLYINGTLAATTDSPATINFADQSITQVGWGNLNGWPAGGLPSFSPFFNGVMDEIRIYNKTLTAAEVQALYNN